MRAAVAVLALLSIPLSAAPSFYVDMPAAWSSAVDHAHTRAFGAGLEIPFAGRHAAVARGSFLHVKQTPWSQDDRSDRFFGMGIPLDYRLWMFQAAWRIYPWEWLPGFYAEALAGCKRGVGENPLAAPSVHSEIRISAEVRSFATWAWEGGIGFGYAWTWAPTRIVLGFAFGPEWIRRGGRDADGNEVHADDWDTSLLRFNSLELGLAF